VCSSDLWLMLKLKAQPEVEDE